MYSIFPKHSIRWNFLLFLQELFYTIVFIDRLRKKIVTIDKNDSLVQQGEETYIILLQWFTKQIVSQSLNKYN